MADPIVYEVTYSFSGWQATNPNLPLPAASLDAQLALIAASIASFDAALSDVRRSDGSIPNGKVGLDTLDDQLQSLIGGTERVLVSDLDPSAIATQAEAQAGVATDKVMAPLRVKQAINSFRAFASQTQMEDADSDAVVMSPLRTKEAIDHFRAFATTDEAENSPTLNTVVLTPKTGREMVRALRRAKSGTAALTWAALANGASATQNVTIAGAEVGDRVVVGFPAAGLQALVLHHEWVSAADTVTLRMSNVSGGALTPPAGDYKFTVLQF